MSETTVSYYIAKALTVDGRTFVAGNWYGMGGVKMPSWADFGPTGFDSKEEALTHANHLPLEGYEFKIDPSTIKIFHRTVHTVITETEIEV